MKIKVKVKPNSKEEKIEKISDYYLVKLKKPAHEGRANMELLKVLKKYFKKNVKIIRGLRSREKVVEVG